MTGAEQSSVGFSAAEVEGRLERKKWRVARSNSRIDGLPLVSSVHSYED